MSGRPSPFLTRPHLVALIFFAIFILLLYHMAELLAPFSPALKRAAIIALPLAPLYRSMVPIFKLDRPEGSVLIVHWRPWCA